MNEANETEEIPETGTRLRVPASFIQLIKMKVDVSRYLRRRIQGRQGPRYAAERTELDFEIAKMEGLSASLDAIPVSRT